MSNIRPVAFYAPLKSPNHPSPSGDRTMARLLMRVLEKSGFPAQLASELRTLDKTGDRQLQDNLRRQSHDEASSLIAHYRALPEQARPRLWFTYHVYYKAPDWIGPQVCEALRIPYVIAEGSRASKRANGPWALAHEGAEAALDRADAVFVMTARDRVALEAARSPGQVLVDFPPFLDLGEWSGPSNADRASEPQRLLVVAMMRDGDKLASYRILASACEHLQRLPWTLDIVGDGEARNEVKKLFAPFGQRVRFHGQIEARTELKALYGNADLFVWPAVNEAYGMVLLEAQLCGCPVVAGAYGGVASVLRPGETGVLTEPGNAVAFAGAVKGLLENRDRLRRMSSAASRFVREERSMERAADRLRQTLTPLVSTIGGRACAF